MAADVALTDGRAFLAVTSAMEMARLQAPVEASKRFRVIVLLVKEAASEAVVVGSVIEAHQAAATARY